MVDSHENRTIGVLSDENFGIFKVPNYVFAHYMFVLYRSPPFKNNKWTPDIAFP